jgi:hypothetical protein
VTDEGLRALAAATALTSLNLSCCHLVTDEGVRALATAPVLDDIDLSWCELVKEKVVGALAIAIARRGEASGAMICEDRDVFFYT